MFFERMPANTRDKASIPDTEQESGPIKLNYRVFAPKSEILPAGPNKKPGIFFHPGWANPIWGEAVRSISSNFADFSGIKTTAFEIRGNPVTLKQREGAEAERKYIEERGFDEVTIVGNSQGGVRAIELADLLQEKNPEIKINGLVLLASKGLGDISKSQNAKDVKETVEPNFLDKIFYKNGDLKYKSEPGEEEIENFFARLLTDPGAEIWKHPVKNSQIWMRANRLNAELFTDFIRQVIEAKGDVSGGITNLRKEMITLNKSLARIRCPVVLIHGESDLMADPNYIMRPNMGLESAREYARAMEQTEYLQRTGRNEVVAEREKFVKENLLPSSTGVKILLADKDKYGNHFIAGFRNLAVSSMSALERLNRVDKE